MKRSTAKTPRGGKRRPPGSEFEALPRVTGQQRALDQHQIRVWLWRVRRLLRGD